MEKMEQIFIPVIHVRSKVATAAVAVVVLMFVSQEAKTVYPRDQDTVPVLVILLDLIQTEIHENILYGYIMTFYDLLWCVHVLNPYVLVLGYFIFSCVSTIYV